MTIRQLWKPFIPFSLLFVCSLPGLLPALSAETVSPPEAEAEFSPDAEIFEIGIASWYAGEFDGKLTANGEVFDAEGISAAHRSLPFGTIVRITNLTNGLRTDVRINDRGPFIEGRIIDLSRGAAELIDMVSQGIAPVELQLLYVPQFPESAYLRPGDTGLVKIQLGAFVSRELAEKLIEFLRESGFDPHLESGAEIFHRVLLRRIDYARLQEVIASLEAIGLTEVWISSD